MLKTYPPILGVLFLTFFSVSSQFINFKKGFEYQYKYDSTADVKNIGIFNVLAKIGYTNIKEDPTGQEIFLRVYTFQLKTKHADEVIDHRTDFSQWFSFVITPQGEITHVYHPGDDDGEAVALKKGAAAMFASRLHHSEEIKSRPTDDGWTYSVRETGHEGEHNATYTVKSTGDGQVFKKVRHPGHHPVKHATSEYIKTLHFDHDLGNIHTVLVQEKVRAMDKPAEGYNPFENTRPVQAVNNFTQMEYPELSAQGSGKLEFLTRHKIDHVPTKPNLKLMTSSIHIKDVKQKKIPVDLETYLRYIKGNLTCMREEPDKGSKKLDSCFTHLGFALNDLSDEQLFTVAKQYLLEKPKLTRTFKDRNHILDAIGSMTTEVSQRILLDLVLNISRPDPFLVKRLLVHLVNLDIPPIDGVIEKLTTLCFDPSSSPPDLQQGETYHRVVLTVGVVARRLWDAERKAESASITEKLENLLGLHDPWQYRKKRSIMTEEEILNDDRWRVILIGSLGNAGLDQSYEMIVSHINTTNSQWVKRAGVHALRKFKHEKAAHMMLRTALYDDDAKVRYEALLQYQAHPQAALIAPRDKQGGSVNGSIFYMDPHHVGIHDIDVYDRHRRADEEGLNFNLASPSVDWKKMLGSTTIGASFGLTISNALLFKIAPLSGHMKVNVHDEAYARIHLGFLGRNLDFFLARVCFKGGAEYNLNMLQEFDITSVRKLVKLYDSIKGSAVGAISDALELFRDIIKGEFSLTDMIEEFKQALEELPEKVVSVGKKAVDAMELLGELEETELPPFVRPARNLVIKVSNLYKEVKTNVLTFYNQLMETVTIIIPRAGKVIYKSIQAIINGFKTFNKDPKQAISTVAGNVINIGLEVTNLIQAINKTRHALNHLKENPPEWMDLTQKVGEILELGVEAATILTTEGQEWVNDVISGDIDPIEEFSKGKVTLADQKREVVRLLKEIVDDVLSPLDALKKLGGKFIETYQKVSKIITDLKDAYNSLKEGYRTARSLIDRVFGPKCHKDFPRTIRQPGGGCGWSGKFKAEGSTYAHEGVDITISEGKTIVAPFEGNIMLSDKPYEVIIVPTGGSLKNTEIIITNIKPNSSIQSSGDSTYVDSGVSAGQPIGEAYNSPCAGNAHIHFSMRRDGGYIDPTRYLEPRIPKIPEWVQECDDYKLVFKFEVLAEDCLICLNGKKENDTSPERKGEEVENPPEVDKGKDPSAAADQENMKPDSFFQKMKSNAPAVQDKAKKTKDGALKTLFKKASAFLKKFSIRNLKMGTILDLLEILGLDDSIDKMSDVIKTIRDMVSNKPCFNPHQLTDDQLRSELIDRQLKAEGSREDMIKALTTPSNSCPLMKISMPDNIYCTFDDKCLGLECCAHFKLFMFRKTYKVFARFDPCDFEFHVGAGGFNKSYGVLDGLADINGGFDKKLPTGIKLDILGGIELVFNLKLEKDDTAAMLTVGVEFCSQDDLDNCLGFFNILDEAVTPLPICHPDGTMTWPKVDYKSLFDKESIKRRIREGAKQFAKDAIKKGLEELVRLIPCVSPDAPGKTEPCPRPERFTMDVLKTRLGNRGLEVGGSRTQLEQRLTKAQQSCSLLDFDVTLPTINNDKVNKLLYMQIAPNCLRFDACFDVNIKAFNFSKTLNAYIDIDPCSFTLTLNLEDCTETKILFGYDWGKPKELDFKGVIIKFMIDRDLTKKVFKVDMGLKLQLGNADPIIDSELLENLEVPIPVCNNNFTLPGSGLLRDLAKEMGGKLIREVVDVIFKQLGLDKIFLDGKCTVPPEPDCPWSLPDYKKLLPTSFEDNVNCTLPDNCFGVQCCVGFVFDVPLFEEPLRKNVPFFMKFEPCNFTVELGFGTYYHREVLLTYNWGSESTLEVGSGNPAPIVIKFKVSQYPQGFILDLHVSTCLPIDDASFCYPQDGMKLLDREKVPACDANALVEYSKQNFSLSSWFDELDLDINLQSLSQAAARMLLDRFGISEHLLDNRCNVIYPPYTPSVYGWMNECPNSTFNLPRLPRGLHCHLAETCTKITCCFDVPFLNMSFNAILDVDMCYYTINATIEKKSVFIHMLGEDTDITKGVSGEVDIVDVFNFKYGLKKKNQQLILDLDLEVCFEESTCLEQFEVLKGTKVPQLICDLDAKWNLRNFSLADWARERGQDLGRGLLRSGVDLVLEQLGIKDKMLTPPCARNSLKYQPAESGNWKSDCELTKSALKLPPINLPANCYLNDKCLGVDCCLYSDLLDISVHASFNIDLCNFLIEGSIEKYSFKHVILDYEWGTEEEATLAGVPVMRINYKIDRLLSQQIFIVDLSVSLCLEGETCGFELKVMDKSRLPMPGCAKLMGFKLSDFSFSDWLREKGGEITAQLSALLLEELGIKHFLLDQQCQNYLDPYRIAVDGWNNECPDIVLPNLPPGVTCHVTDYCTGISCCAEVPEIRRNFNAYLYLDSCNYNLRVGIEKLEFTHTLFDYAWDEPKVMDLGGIFRIEYTITEGEKRLLVDLSLKVCFTANEDCKITIPIFVGLIVPKPFCDWEATKQLTDFSLSEFVKEQGEILGDRLSKDLVDKVLGSLGVSFYLLDTQCSLDNRPDNGWTSVCPKTIPFPALPTTLSCSVPKHCTAIDCCLDLPLFNRHVHFKVDLDMCSMELTLAIEKLEFKTLLFKQKWGKPSSFHLKKIFRADYIIDKLEGEKQFVISLNISVCLEAGKKCFVSVPVLKQARFPNPVCDWNSTLSLRGFSLSDWLEEQKLAIGQDLSAALRFQLAVSLGISQYLLEPMCSRQHGIYLADSKGWNNACPKSVPNLPTLPSSLSCNIPDYCTGLDCCVYLDALGWSFNFKILLDTRNYVLTIGIEKLFFKTTLFHYNWGNWEFFNLNGVVRLGFKIEDLHHAWKYLLSVKLSLCFESNKPCVLDVPVLTDISFPKLIWNWDNPFSLEGNDFSLKSWLSEMNLPSAADIAGLALSKLLDKTGLSIYLADPQCDRDNAPYVGAVAGWKKDCPANIALPSLPSSVTCHLSDPCGTVECCVEVGVLQRSLQFKIGINPCTYTFTMGIEKLVFTRTLVYYKWGTVEHFSLKDRVRLEFTIDDLYGEKKFLVNMKAKICFEKNTCIDAFTVLDNVKIPKLVCDWESTAALTDFSLSDFLAEMKATSLTKLTQAIAARLFERLEIAGILQTQQCNIRGGSYTPATSGWKNDCPVPGLDQYLPPLPSSLACHVTKKCTAIDCCVDIDFLSRSFHVFLFVDMCNNQLTVQVEQIEYTHMLFDYDWGKEDHFYVKGVIRIDFKIARRPGYKQLEVTASLRVCLKKDQCLFTKQLLDKARVPIPLCDWEAMLAANDFSLSNWASGKGISSALSSLTDTLISQLMNDLGITQFLNNPGCSQEATLYVPADIRNWKKECTSAVVPSLPEAMRCNLDPTCSVIDCCASVPLLKRNIHARVHVDICKLELHLTIEKFTYDISLLKYEWGTKGHFVIGFMSRIEYMLVHHPSAQKLVVDVTIKVCFETTACYLDVPVFTQSEIIYSPCNPSLPVPFKGVSFDFWKVEKCDLGSTTCSEPLPSPLQGVCQLTDNCMGITCCVAVDLDYLGVYKFSAGVMVDHCSDKLRYFVENKLWIKNLPAIEYDKTHTEPIGNAIEISYIISKTPTLYKVSLHLKICALNGYTLTDKCHNFNIVDQMSFTIPSSCDPSKRRKRSSLTSFDKKNLKTVLSDALNQDFTNEQMDNLFKSIQEEERQGKLTVEDVDADGTATNPRTALRKMGRANPGAILYSGEVGGGNVVLSMEGGEKIMKVLGKVSDVLGRSDQTYTVGKGLTGKGLELLGAKLANMSIGEMMAMFDAKNIDPVLALRLTRQLRDLALALYSEIIEAIINGDAADTFGSFDLTLAGDFSFPRQNINFFHYKYYFLIGGIVPMTFEFGAGASYGMGVVAGAKILGMTVFGEVVPYGSAHVFGEMGIGFILYGKLRFDGYLMNIAFPSRAEIGFYKFPLDLRLTMDMELVPLRMTLKGLVTLEINLLFTTIKKTLYSATIWQYSTPVVRKRLVDTGTKEEDESPPQFLNYVDNTGKSGRKKRAIYSTRNCLVRQLPGRDYTEAAVEVAVAAEDDRSQVQLYLDVGTKPGLSDVISRTNLGGPSTIVTEKFKKYGVPMFFSVFGENSAGSRTTVTCDIPTYDVTVPGGRLTADFRSTSNPGQLHGHVVVYEDSQLVTSAIGVGLGMGIYADEVIPFNSIDLSQRDNGNYNPSTDNFGHGALEHFTGLKVGRLIGPVFAEFNNMNHAGACVKECMMYPEGKCLSVNYDFGTSGHCELMEAIEGHHYQLSVSGQYTHYERIGVGLAYEFIYRDLSLLHRGMYYFNLHLVNVLGFESILHSEGVVVDTTPPEPGRVSNVGQDSLGIARCQSLIPDQRPEWKDRCRGVDVNLKNHRIIHDGPGSMTVFNGAEALTDLLYTRANRYLSANWDGIHDKETGILGYSWTVGRAVCLEEIHPHHDPFFHLFHESEWTHKGIISPIPEKYDPLPDGKYYITLRALNKVEYGGPLVTTICHTTPLGIDNSPPFMHDIYNITYDEDTFLITAMYNASDPESDIREIDLCLGANTRNCDHLDWTRSGHLEGVISRTFQIPGGKAVWVKLRAVNHVDLMRVGVADHPIIVDTSPPEAGQVFDGPVYKHDLNYTKDADSICGNWFEFFDPESGISHYELTVLDETSTRIIEPVSVDHKTHETCVDIPPDQRLQHGRTYSFHVTAFNAGHKQLNVSAVSNGVIVDLTVPVSGEVVDGREAWSPDLQYSTHVATVGTQWRGFYDPESDIRDYEVKILRAQELSEDFRVLKDWKPLDKEASEVEWHNFHLEHRDRVKTVLRATNNALGKVEQTTDGFVVDLTPPEMSFLGDGLEANKDKEYQESDTTVEVNFAFSDAESGIDHYKFQVYEQYQGRKQQIYPATGWEELGDASTTTYTQSGLSLRLGAIYSVRVGAVNQARAVSIYDSNGVKVDNTKPKISWLYVGILSGIHEHKVEDYVVQSDPEGIKATWSGRDHQSGVQSYMVAVGTSEGGTDVLDWKDTGPETDRYIDGLTLTVTDKNTNTPVYYVSVKAINGAGLTSDVRTSTPIRVVEQDRAGVVIDGADGTEGEFTSIGQDMDYQLNAGVVTVQFSGFQSHEHGVTHYDWAVGTTSGGEEVQPFVRAGLVHRESEPDVPGNGLASMGYAQAVLPLVADTKYYTTVRGITDNGNILQTTSDGFIVDHTPPTLSFESFASEDNETRLTPTTMLYQSETDSMSASWRVLDSETPVKKMYYSVGTYPYGEDVQSRTEVEPLLTGEASLPTGIKPVTNGKPNILTLTAENEVGLTSSIVSPSLVVDITSPTEGTLSCPTFIQPHSPLECEWEGFYDAESTIEGYEFSVGSHEGLEDVVSPIPLSGSTNKHLLRGLADKVLHGKSYYAKIKAINAVGQSSSTISKSINVDVTAPIPGRVVELSSAYFIDVTSDINTEKMNQYRCDTEEECLRIDAVCQESLDTVNIAWQAFTDGETEIVKYEIAVGTSPGGGQLKAFFETDDLTKRYMSLSGFSLKGERQVFVTVKGTNGAGLSSISTSNGIYLSYLSRGMQPLSHIAVMDGNDANGDRNYQTSLTQMNARWDVSGDPCPVVKYEWSIQRADGLVVQEYLDMGVQTHGINDQLSMKNKEWYAQYLRVTNALGYTYTIRSNGVTIEEDPLLPGEVNDGDVISFDLQFLRTMTKISANWDKFGSDGLLEEARVEATDAVEDRHPSNQEIAFYEVAVGTDRRFHKTRYNVVPFTNVHLNKTVTFYDLDLTPYRATYYFTVRAHSTSGSQTDVTSNGFSVGFDGGVEAGYINMQDYISTDTWLDVQWDGFESKIGMMMYYVGLSSNPGAEDHKCGEFMERGSVADEEMKKLFNIAEIRNVGEDTFMKFEELNLEQNGIYYAWVIGADQAGKCNMTRHRFQIDRTPPVEGQIRTGPYFGLKLGYSSVSDSMQIHWQGFSDEDSGLRCYHASLYRKLSCDAGAKEELVLESIEIEASYSSYKFMALEMQSNVPYFARLVAENMAGSKTTVDSPPVLYDNSVPSSGVVVDGHNFTEDVSWIGTNSIVQGTFLNHPVPDVSPCAVRKIPLDGMAWKPLQSSRNFDSSNRSLTLAFRSANIHAKSGKVDIKLARDPKGRMMYSGSYYRDADLVNGGEYKLSIKAADGDGEAVTSVLFWDGPESYILDYDYTPKPDWATTNCACCLEEPVNVARCKCNCKRYLAAKEYYKKLQKRSTDEDGYQVRQLTEEEKAALRNKASLKEKTHIGDPVLTPRQSCGIQLYSGSTDSTGRLVVWCSFGDYLNPSVETVRELSVNPSKQKHQYTVSFTRQMDEARGSVVTWCMYVYMDGAEMSELCGIPRLSPDTKLYLGVWNHKNALPDTGRDKEGHPRVWSTTASFSDLVIPPEKEKLCRYGKPFQGGNNAIVRYEAAIGSAAGLSDVVGFTQVHSPCIPCLKACDMFTCQSSCDGSSTEQVQITLSGLDLPETTITDGEVKPALYYLTVKAVLGSGTSSVASSDGFNIDTSPPDFQEDVLLYIDVSQGEFTPVSYQGSNSTIKAIWKCEDSESEIVEYRWAIGLQPGGEDVQGFTSTGEFPGSSNTDLEGVLQHNTTYYVTVQCRNGGGLTTTYADTKGVTVLLEPPEVDDVETAIEEAEPIGDDVRPVNSMKTTDPHTVGASWTVAEDQSVRRYDFGVGSRNDRQGDIFPYTMVGYNTSGTVAIKDGYLIRDGHNLYKLSQYKKNYNGTFDDPTDKSALTVAAGTVMFVNMKMCNEAELCAVKLLGSTVVETQRSRVGTSHHGSRVRVLVPRRRSIGSRRKRDVDDVLVETPGLEEGQSILVTELTHADLQTEYKSDASVEFVPYITDPESTTDDVFLERILRQRVYYTSTDTSFSVTSIGGLPLPGPLSLTFTFDPSKVNTTLMLLHWNPDARQWQQSNKTCQYETDTEVRNETSSTVTIKVCDTRGTTDTDAFDRFRRSVSDTYFRHPTQFLITEALTEIPNAPPELTSVTSLTMEEDGGTLIYQMRARDDNGDLFKFQLSSGFNKDDLDLVLSDDGLMTFDPAKDFNGRVTVPVTLYEVELVEIPPKEVHVNISIDVNAVNDPPEAFAFSNGTNILHDDPVHPVVILLEQVRANDSTSSSYTWQFGVYDVDERENISIFNTEVQSGNLTVAAVQTSPRCSLLSALPCTDMSLPHSPSSLAWAYRTFNYEPDTDYYGNDEVRLYARDQLGVYSDVITLSMAIMERPCQNGATCESKNESLYTCDDSRRAEGFDLYYTCACAPGWTGIHCEDNIDECISLPCSSPFVCYDKINSYVCACPETSPNCDSFQPWMIALVVLAVILLIVISVIFWYIFVVKKGRLRWSTLSDRILGDSSGTEMTSYYNGDFSDDIWDDTQQHPGQRSRQYPKDPSWVIYKKQARHDWTGPMREEEGFRRAPMVRDRPIDPMPDYDLETVSGERANRSNNANRSPTNMIPRLRSFTPVEEVRTGSTENLVKRRGPYKLTFHDEPVPDYDI